jgi:hypothetical protein
MESWVQNVSNYFIPMTTRRKEKDCIGLSPFV